MTDKDKLYYEEKSDLDKLRFQREMNTYTQQLVKVKNSGHF